MYKRYFKNQNPFTSIVETWKGVEGYEEYYDVSSFGRVRSKDKVRYKVRQGKEVCAFYKGKEISLKVSKSGYAVLTVQDNGEKNHPSVHRLVALAFVPNPENKPTVNHIDGNKLNNNVGNLEWANHSEQTVHAITTGLMKVRGTPIYSPEFKAEVYEYYLENKCSISQLSVTFNISQKTAASISRGNVQRKGLTISEEDIPTIIKLKNEGKTLKSIADLFGCGTSQIHRIVNGKSRNVQYERTSALGNVERIKTEEQEKNIV